MSSMLHPVARKALTAMANIATASKECVDDRVNQDVENAPGKTRRDLMQQFLDIKREKGDKVDFGIPEVKAEAHTAL